MYVSTIEPSENIGILPSHKVHGIPRCPSKVINRIQPKLQKRAENLVHSVELMRHLPTSVQRIARPVIERSRYMAHPEASLLVMLADADEDVRQQAVASMVRSREEAIDECRSYQCDQLQSKTWHAARRLAPGAHH